MHKFLEISYYNINDKKIERKKNSSDNLKGGQRTKKEGKRREENVVSRGIKSSNLVRVLVAKWRRHGTAEISAVGPVGKESNNIWTPVTMALTNRGLGLEDFRSERSAAGSPVCTSTPRVPASLCHYYRGTFPTVSIAVDNTLLTLPPLCRPRRSQLDVERPPTPMIPPLISISPPYFHLFRETWGAFIQCSRSLVNC